MSNLYFVKNLTDEQKSKLVHGNGEWHTNSVENLPAIMMTDGPHGLRKQADKNNGINDSKIATCFPTACAVASSWNVDNAGLVADSIASEAIDENISVVLGPGVNIKRSPLCGRNFEYFSEDPLLAGEMGTAFVNGMQNRGVGCSVKHFAVNSQEYDRMIVNAVVDERALREIYLSAFERVVKNAKPYTIMAAYNKINGESCTQNKKLLTSILREEWGFDGLVVSDWGACYDVAKAYNAGMDLKMPDAGSIHEKITLKAIRNEAILPENIDRACKNVVNLVERCNATIKQKNNSNHHDVCRNIENDCAVLLKNEDEILPLKKDTKIAVVGQFADAPRFQGGGSSHINAQCKSFLKVLEENKIKFSYSQGYDVLCDEPIEKLERQALDVVQNADVVLFFGGLTDKFEGEGFDRKTLDIPKCQINLIEKIADVNKNIIYVAMAGSPFAIDWTKNVKAVLNMYLGGEAVTESAYDLLFGNVSPSGRLAETYPLSLSDTPCYNYFEKEKYLDEHRESIFVGYRFYNTFDVPVAYPFGYGLSYTKFEYSNLVVNRVENGYDVSVRVTNIGNLDGAEVVQVYVDNCDCGLMRAKRELRAFTKIFLAKGQSKIVLLHLDERAFSIWYNNKFTVVNGNYKICICSNVNTVVDSTSVEVSFGENIVENDKLNYPDYFKKIDSGSDFVIEEKQFYSLCGFSKQCYVVPKRGKITLQNTIGDLILVKAPFAKSVEKYIKKSAINGSPTKRFDDPVAQIHYNMGLGTPLFSLMNDERAKLVFFLLNFANRHYIKAIKSLFGKFEI